MKSQWLLTMLSGLLLGLGAAASMADQPPSAGTPPREQATPPAEAATTPGEQDVTPPGEMQPREETAKKHAGGFRASTLIGMKVENKEGEKLGSIEDLVLDPQTGTIRYAALARGGFLGIGEKLVAVPWTAFECQTKQREQRAFRGEDQRETGVVSDDRVALILDIDAKTLEQHPGFKEDSWPESGDASLMKSRAQPVEESVPAEQPDRLDGSAEQAPEEGTSTTPGDPK